MELSRTQPFPLTFSLTGYSPEQEYVLAIMDDYAQDLSELSIASNLDGEIIVTLPNYYARYDAEYRIELYVKDGENEDGSAVRGDLLYIDNLTIMRPYFDVSEIYNTPEEIEEAKQYEAIARSIINSITDGFMYTLEDYEAVGMGNDYLYIPSRINRVIRVVENDILVFNAQDKDFKTNREYYVTPDKTAISIYMPSAFGYNRMQSAPVFPRQSASDSFTLYNTNDSPNIIQNIIGSPMFPKNFDYVVTFEAGWPVIPNDIKYCTRLLINDLKCNNLPYINSFISEYKSDQFNIKIDKQAFSNGSTGNRIVDKILSSYTDSVRRIGVL
jgi:hypothetical protein